MKIINVNKTPYMSRLKRLYNQSFPAAEKKPFTMMLKLCREKRMEIFAVVNDENNMKWWDKGNFIGLAIFVYYNDLVLLDYFAIDKRLRSNGYGSSALALIKKMFSDRKLFLEIESVYCECDDIDNRKLRRKFYMANGMQSQGYIVELFGVDMEILSVGSSVAYEEYEALYRSFLPKQLINNVKFIKTI